MPITPEQAKAELARRELARRELARRELARRELARRELAKRGISAEEKPIPEPQTAAENFTYPLKNAYKIQQEEAREGIESMKNVVTEPGIKNTLLGGLGALQYGYSPVTGAAKGIVGEPIERAAKRLGVPDKGAEFIGRLAENAVYFAFPGAAIKNAMMGLKAAPGLKAAGKITQATVEQLNKAKPAFTIKKAESAVSAPQLQPWERDATKLSKDQFIKKYGKWDYSGEGGGSLLNASEDSRKASYIGRLVSAGNTKHSFDEASTNLQLIGENSETGVKFYFNSPYPYDKVSESVRRSSGIIAVKDGRIVGKIANPKETRGKHLVVSPEYQKQGISQQLMDLADNIGVGVPSPSPALTSKEGAAALFRYARGKYGAEVSSAGNPAASILMQPQLKESVVKDVVEATRASLDTLQFDKSKRLFRNISDFLKTGEIQVQDLPGILKAENITPEEFAWIWTDTISRAGRELNHLSRLSKDMGFVFKENKAAADAFERTHAQYKEGQYLWEKIGDGIARIEDFRRGLLVTQLATTMRNISSQTGRLVLAQFDEALQATINQGMKAVNLTDEATNGINIINAAYSRFSKNGRMAFDRIMDADKAATYRARLISQSVHEVPAAGGAVDATVGRLAHMGQKFTYALNILNRAQEHFFRKIAFEAKLKQELANMGKDFSKVNPAEIPESVFEKATQYALEMTFAASPKSKTGRDFINIWRKFGLTTVNPFPRFAFANALPFMLEHSPLGYRKALSPEAIKGLTSGNPEKFSKAVSRATLGTLMLKSAWHFRQSEYAGEKWYQIKLSEDKKTGEAKYMDIRAFAPFSTYFFLAEAMQHPERMSGKDYFEAAIGLNRTAGTGLVVIDLLRSKKTETTAKLMQNFVNAYASSFTVPLRTPKDLIAGFDPEEAKLRDTKDDPKWGPLAGAMGNIPYVSQQFPEAVNPLSTRVKESETPILRQTTGVSITTKNATEREVDRLGIDWTSVYPKTGFDDSDRDISRKMSPVIEKVGPILFKYPAYKHGSDAWKKFLLERVIRETKAYASKLYASENPERAAQISYERMDDDLKAIVEEVMKNNPVIGKLKTK